MFGIVPHGKDKLSDSITHLFLESITLPKTVLILAPNHYERGPKFSIKSKGSWIQEEFASLILEHCPWLREDETALIEDESFARLIGLISQHTPEVHIVPVLFQHTTFERCESIAKGLFQAIQQFQGPVLTLATAHLSQFEEINKIKAQDQSLLTCIQNLNPKEFYAASISAERASCGNIPVTVLLAMAETMGIQQAQVKDYNILTDSGNNLATSYVSISLDSD